MSYSWATSLNANASYSPSASKLLHGPSFNVDLPTDDTYDTISSYGSDPHRHSSLYEHMHTVTPIVRNRPLSLPPRDVSSHRITLNITNAVEHNKRRPSSSCLAISDLPPNLMDHNTPAQCDPSAPITGTHNVYNRKLGITSDGLTPDKPYTLLLINARSIKNKIHHLGPFIIMSNAHVVLVTETWLSDSSPDTSFNIPGYTAFCNGRVNHRGGGSLIYVCDALNPDTFHIIPMGNPEDSIWIQATGGKHDLLIGCIYNRPYAANTDTNDLIELFSEASLLSARHMIIGGDFNMPQIDWYNQTAPPRYRPFVDLTFAYNWDQHVHAPTRNANTLDLIFTRGISNARAHVLGKLPGCDHNVVKLSFTLPSTRSSNLNTSSVFRPFQRANWECFATLIRSLDWDIFFLTGDTNTATYVMYHHFTYCLDVIAPFQTLTKRTRPKGDAYTRKVLLKLKKLRSSYNKVKDFHLIIRMNELQTQWRNHQATYATSAEHSAINNSNNKVKALTHLLKSRTNNNASTIVSLTLTDGSVTTDPAQLCNIANKHFCDSYASADSAPPPVTPKVTDEELNLINFDLRDITQALSSLKSCNYPGPDGIPSALLKYGGPDIPLLLLNIFTLSMTRHVFPNMWKHAVVIPRHKRGSRLNIDNYRPISHTPIASRIMERLVKAAMLRFLLPHNLLNRSQHGFLPAKSCQTCMFEFLNGVTTAIDSGQALVIVFLDMTKAFDRVPHSKLLTKLASFGICGRLLSWFSSYLSNRTQSVHLGGASSPRAPVTSGVFQGSVLGPLLFLLYVNDIFPVFRRGTPYLFADDIKVVFPFEPNDLHNALPHIQSDINALESWSTLWKLDFSPQKCSTLSYRCIVPPNTLTFRGAPLDVSQSVRDLGVHYSSSFNFAEQASYSAAKARSMIGYIFKSMSLLESRLLLYKTCARPVLEYCSIVLTNSRKCDRVAIESVQRSFTKRLLAPSTLNYRGRCQQLGLEPLWLRRLRCNLIFLFNITKAPDTILARYFRSTGDARYDLRNMNYSFYLPIAHSGVRYNFFLYRYAKVWNRLPLALRSSETTAQFAGAVHRILSVSSVAEMLSITTPVDELWEKGPDSI